MPISLDDILQTIRTRESGGNYTVKAPKSSASGAYQFIDSTWQGLTKRYGIDGAPASARDASPAMQDLVAGRYVADILESHGGDVRAVPAVWYVGRYDPANLDYVPSPEAGNSLSVREYVGHWLDDLGETTGAAVDGGVDIGPPAGGRADGADAERLETFLEAAMSQKGDPYVWGGKHDGMIDNPNGFDCSGLVSWAADRAGVDMVNGSWLQFADLERRGGVLSVEEALDTPGALVFRFSSDPRAGGRPRQAHVAISLGDGRVVEAVNAGVLVREADPERFTHAAAIPDMGTELTGEVVTDDLEPLPGTDSDGDGLLDQHELLIGTDPFDADTDLDGFIDSIEVMEHRSDPLDFADNVLVRATGQLPAYRPPLSFELRGETPGAPLDDPFHGGLSPGLRVDIDQSSLTLLTEVGDATDAGDSDEPAPVDEIVASGMSLDDRVDALLEGIAPGSLAGALADGSLDDDLRDLLDAIAEGGEVDETTRDLVESVFGENWEDELDDD